MYIEERHRAILEWLSQHGSISNTDIQKNFDVSYDSAKRDLRILEEKGLLKRTFKDIPQINPNYLQIAKEAVSLIQENDVIYIPSTTLGLFMVKNLPAHLKIKVVTNSILIADELRTLTDVSVIILGGEMDNKGNCYDTIAVETVKRLRLDKCFITSACISASFGLSIQSTPYISFFNALIDSSRLTIGLYPKEKIGFDSIVSICPANRLNTLITDWDSSEQDLSLFDKLGIKVIVVDNPE